MGSLSGEVPKCGLHFNRVALAAVLGTDVGVGQGRGAQVGGRGDDHEGTW